MAQAKRELPGELRLFCWVAACSTVLTFVVLRHAQKWGLPFPHNWPLFPPGASFLDYSDYFERFKLLHTAKFFTETGYPFTYMAPGAVLYKAFYIFGERGGLLAYFLVAAAVTLSGIAKARYEMLQRGLDLTATERFLLLTLLTSYPLALCLERGNLEIVVVAGLGVGTWAYWKHDSWTAAILWGIFGSIKLYPLLLLAVFISFRQYRQLLLALAAAAVTTVAALWWVGPNLHTAALGIADGLKSFMKIYGVNYGQQMGFDHSIFALIKALSHSHHPNLHTLFARYFAIFSVGMLALFFARIRKLPVANQLAILTICSITLPPTSWDYSLVQLYPSFLILTLVTLDGAAGKKAEYGRMLVFLLFGLLFTSMNFYFRHEQVTSGHLRCLLLMVLFGVLLVCPFDEPAREEKSFEMNEAVALH